MEVENENLESTEAVIEPQLAETETAEHAPEEAAIAAEGEAAPEVEGEAAEWEPNYQYKVKDDLHDMEEWAKPLITTKEIEDQLKVLHSKGHGIEDIKTDRTTFRDERDSFKEKYESSDVELGNMKQSLEMISKFVAEDKMDMFFNALQIPEDKILKWAVEKFKYKEMDPQQQQQIDYQKNQEQQLHESQWQNQQLQTQQEQFQINQRVMELDNAVSDPSVVSIAQQFDQRAGKVGAFKEQVIMMGNHYDVTFGQDLSVQEAVQKTVEQYSGILGHTPANTSVANTPQGNTIAPTPNQVPQGEKPVIPNIRGRGTSPVKSSPTSIDDLRKLHQQKAAAEGGL